MRELIGDLELSLDQASAIAKAMRKVAASDGIHARETAMIDGFYSVCVKEAGQEGAVLDKASFDAAFAKEVLNSPLHLEALFKSCYLLALADGRISIAEDQCIKQIATDVGVDASELHQWSVQAKVYLLSQFEGVDLFQDEAFAIGVSLGLTEEVIRETLNLASN